MVTFCTELVQLYNVMSNLIRLLLFQPWCFLKPSYKTCTGRLVTLAGCWVNKTTLYSVPRIQLINMYSAPKIHMLHADKPFLNSMMSASFWTHNYFAHMCHKVYSFMSNVHIYATYTNAHKCHIHFYVRYTTMSKNAFLNNICMHFFI